jgi:hypothetical protein
MRDLIVAFVIMMAFAGLGFCAFICWLMHRERLAQINKDWEV